MKKFLTLTKAKYTPYGVYHTEIGWIDAMRCYSSYAQGRSSERFLDR
jgi:hypothetical protein